MFDFLRRLTRSARSTRTDAAGETPTIAQALPALHPDNPGQGSVLILRAEGGEAPGLQFDLVEVLQKVLQEEGVAARRRDEALELDNGMLLQPRFLEVQGADGRYRSATTLQIDHPQLCPDGLFEYQHAAGADVRDALRNGFRNWTLMDRIALSAALEPGTDTCMTMRRTLADGRERRIVLGPFSHFMSEPPEAGTAAAEEAEKFCPCCLFSSADEALMPLIESGGTVGLRLFASLTPDGPMADCRVNGNDHPEAAEALRRYAAGWLPKGEFEFRKQYVVIHDVDAGRA
jgi:hypothetical protein